MSTTPPIDNGDGPIISPLLTRAEAAEYLRGSERHIDNLRTRGELPATAIGRRVYFQKAVLDDFIRRQTEALTGPASGPTERGASKPDSQPAGSGGTRLESEIA